MRLATHFLASLLVLVIAAGAAGAEQPSTSARPCKSNDECDQWAFEQLDRQLAAFVPNILADIDRFAHPSTREAARAGFTEAQRLWLAFRDSACQAEAARMFLRSARTTAGYTSGCLLQMSSERLQELQQRFVGARP